MSKAKKEKPAKADKKQDSKQVQERGEAMADVHYEVDESLKKGRDFMEAVRDLSRAWDKLVRVRGTQEQMKLASTDFTQVAAQFGYTGSDDTAKEANAEASFGETDSMYGTCNAAIQQWINRHI